jgi:hypothetical protein
VPPPSKENRKKLVVTTTLFYPDVLFIGGRVESSPISDEKNQPCLGKNRLSGKLVDEGTDAETPGDIMKSENEIRRSLCREMRFRRWEKL